MAKKPKYDIDGDRTFDISDEAKNNALDRRLIQLLERIDTLEDEKKGIADDIKDVYSEAKSMGYDATIMRKIRALRKMKPDDRAEMEAVLETYKRATGL